MNLLKDIAKYLHAEGIGVFDETGVTGNIFMALIPSTPDVCIGVYPTGGLTADGRLNYDRPTVQIWVRGDLDPRTGMDLALSVYNKMQGFHHDTFTAGGYWILNCIGVQSFPQHVGRDENDRHEYSINFQLEILNPERENSDE